MYIHKVAVVGGFAVATALALAPLASADDLTDTINTEIGNMNAQFLGVTGLAGVPSADVELGGGAAYDGSTNHFDIINPTDVSAVQVSSGGTDTTPFDYLVYGVNPTAAGVASDPGAFTLGNGSLVEFYDAYNAFDWGLLHGDLFTGTATSPATDLIPATDLFGSSTEIANALATGSDWGAAMTFFDVGLADLSTYFFG